MILGLRVGEVIEDGTVLITARAGNLVVEYRARADETALPLRADYSCSLFQHSLTLWAGRRIAGHARRFRLGR